MNAWKVATLVFGLSLAVLIARRVQEQQTAPRTERPAGATTSLTDNQGHAREAHRVGERSAESADSDFEEVTVASLPEDPAEFVLSLVYMYPGQRTLLVSEERCDELLRQRAREVTAVLEGWIHRVVTEGPQPFINERNLCKTYADLLGAGAIPLLTEMARGDARHAAIEGLCRIDAEEGAAILAQLQADAPERVWIVDPTTLIQGGAASSRRLALQWARFAPPNDPALAAGARWSVFVQGTDSEREQMLELATGDERDRLLVTMNPRWGEKWRNRLLHEIPRMIRSDDPKRRLLAAFAMTNHLELYDEALREEVEALVHTELMSQTDPERNKKLSALARQLGKQSRERKRAERWHAELLR